MDKNLGIENIEIKSSSLTPDARHMTQNRPLMQGGRALLGIVDALCPSVGQRDKEGSIRKQKRREGGGWNYVGGHLFPLRLILYQRILGNKLHQQKNVLGDYMQYRSP